MSRDSGLPPPSVAFFGTVASIFAGLAILALAVWLAGCHAMPPPLTAASDASNAAADEITALVAAYTRRVKSEAVRAEKSCKVQDRACRQDAVMGVLRAHSEEGIRLSRLGMTQHMIVDALGAARTCHQAKDDACLYESLKDAVELESELNALIADYHRELPQSTNPAGPGS